MGRHSAVPAQERKTVGVDRIRPMGRSRVLFYKRRFAAEGVIPPPFFVLVLT